VSSDGEARVPRISVPSRASERRRTTVGFAGTVREEHRGSSVATISSTRSRCSTRSFAEPASHSASASPSDGERGTVPANACDTTALPRRPMTSSGEAPTSLPPGTGTENGEKTPSEAHSDRRTADGSTGSGRRSSTMRPRTTFRSFRARTSATAPATAAA
jgi:hypothetical protein